MSTHYAIFNREIEIEKHGHAIWDEDVDDFLIIGRSHDFTLDGEIIQKYLRDETPVYAIDNDSHIRTIKDLREYYER